MKGSTSYGGCSGKESTCQGRRLKRRRFDAWGGKRRRKWQSTGVFLPGKSHGLRSLADYSPWGHKKSNTHTHTHTHRHTAPTVNKKRSILKYTIKKIKTLRANRRF